MIRLDRERSYTNTSIERMLKKEQIRTQDDEKAMIGLVGTYSKLTLTAGNNIFFNSNESSITYDPLDVDKSVTINISNSPTYESIKIGTANSHVELKNDAAQSTSYSLTLPTSDGASNTALCNNGSGVLSWVNVLPTGSIMMFASNATPDASVWLPCNGASVSAVTYSALYALIGATYGATTGSGLTLQFKIPNLSNQFVRCTNFDSNGNAINVDGTAHSYSTAKPTNLSNTTSTEGAHTHEHQDFYAQTSNQDTNLAGALFGGVDVNVGLNTTTKRTSTLAGEHTHTLSFDNETAPMHVYMLFCIKT